LENVALNYLGRFAATAASLERVLMKRVRRSARHHGTEVQAGANMVAELILRYRATGLLDDRRFAEARARTLNARGVPLRAIRMRLRAKGVDTDDIDAALAVLKEELALDGAEDADLAAARAYIRRRRIGPFRNADVRAEWEERDLAALARAGFSYDTAKAVLTASTEP
jgi:regulatory protein